MKHLTCSVNFWRTRRLSVRKAGNAAVCFLTLITLVVIQARLEANSDRVGDVYGLIDDGRIDEARSLLDSLIAADYTNSERYYLLALLTEDASRASQHLYHALEIGRDPDVMALSLVALADYHLLYGDYEPGLEVVDRYQKKCRKSTHYPEVLLRRARLRLEIGKGHKSDKELRKASESCRDPDVSARILLTLGEIMLEKKKPDKAIAYFTRVSQAANERYVGIALLRLLDLYLAEGDDDKAHTTYQIVIAGYPHIPGLDQLSRRLGVSEAAAHVTEREVMYAIRVGTFSKRASAEKLQGQFSAQGYTVQLISVQISGRKYYVVDLGRFDSPDAAADLLEKLEKENRDKYHVVRL